jgi:GTPase
MPKEKVHISLVVIGHVDAGKLVFSGSEYCMSERNDGMKQDEEATRVIRYVIRSNDCSGHSVRSSVSLYYILTHQESPPQLVT